MSIEERLRSILLEESEITSLVGDRIRPDELAQEDGFPAILIEIEDEDPLNMLSEVGGLQKAKVQITGLAESKAVARNLGKAVRKKLDGFKEVVDEVEVDATFEKRENGFEPNDDGEDTGVYFSMCEFEVWWDESTEEE